MAYLLVFLSGVFLACMQSFNGQLNASIGMYATSFFVHVIGGIVLFLYIHFVKKEKIIFGPMPFYAYLGGICGLLMVSFTSLTIYNIGNVLFTCISICGQIFLSIVIDHFGLFGIKKTSFNLKRIPALILIAIGVLIINFGG